MPFTRTDGTQLLALKNEITLDPIGMGYAGKTINEQVFLLNDAGSNLGGEIGNAPVTARAMLDALFDVAISSQDQFKIQLLFEGSESFDTDLSEFKARVGALSAGIAIALSTITRPLNRAEVLFAVDDLNGIKENITISKQDILATGGI